LHQILFLFSLPRAVTANFQQNPSACKENWTTAMSDIRRFYACHDQLLRWQDELEFLCYLFCELVCPHELEKVGFQCHQAVDLPNFIKIIKSACTQVTHNSANARLEVSKLQEALEETKVVRNAAAHHVLLQKKTMKAKKVVQTAIQELERLVKSVAASRHVRYVSNKYRLVIKGPINISNHS
jgi:hypothetical protein